MRKKGKRLFILAGSTLLILFILLSGFIGYQVFTSSTQLVTNAQTHGIHTTVLRNQGLVYEDFRRTYVIEELAIPSTFEDHTIPADYIYAKNSNHSKDHPTIILVHGLGDNRYCTYPLAEFFLEEGFNVLAYDQRSSNENTAEYTTFGYFEKFDLIDWANEIHAQASGQTLGIWGMSFGAATAGLASGTGELDGKVDFLILDSPVSSMEWMVEKEMKGMEVGLPLPYLTFCGNTVNKWQLGFGYENADVAEAMKETTIPVLVVNSRQDSVTPYFMGRDIYEAVPGEEKEIWTVEDSEHAEIWLDYNQEYREKLTHTMSRFQKGTER